ncbi:MAG TPA: hypothetical protein VHH36_07505, partial [Candidatus Thermoplasmatota archaeon]|nr:hypothetical protein [Candidatus Thermoplasmatota archaeon]
VADASGRFAFEDARVEERQLVAGTEVPFRTRVTPSAQVDVATNATGGWTLRGIAKRADGAGLAADVVAWNGTTLWSVARANEAGHFALPLPPENVALRVEARTADGHHGGVLARQVNGPPGAVETVLLRPLC